MTLDEIVWAANEEALRLIGLGRNSEAADIMAVAADAAEEAGDRRAISLRNTARRLRVAAWLRQHGIAVHFGLVHPYQLTGEDETLFHIDVVAEGLGLGLFAEVLPSGLFREVSWEEVHRRVWREV